MLAADDDVEQVDRSMGWVRVSLFSSGVYRSDDSKLVVFLGGGK